MNQVTRQPSAKAVFKGTLPGHRVQVFGRQLPLDSPQGRAHASHLLAHMSPPPKPPLTLLIKPPVPNANPFSGKLLVLDQVATTDSDQFQVADAVIVHNQRTRLLMETRDCPVTVLVNPLRGSVGIVHCARDYLKQGPSDSWDLLTQAVLTIAPSNPERTALCALICAGIGAPHFAHQRAPHVVERFQARFGWEVFTAEKENRWALDLRQVIVRILSSELRVPEANIGWDGLCTFSHPKLGSYRACKSGPNYTCLVPNKPAR